jgi:hypothetical protein
MDKHNADVLHSIQEAPFVLHVCSRRLGPMTRCIAEWVSVILQVLETG